MAVPGHDSLGWCTQVMGKSRRGAQVPLIRLVSPRADRVGGSNAHDDENESSGELPPNAHTRSVGICRAGLDDPVRADAPSGRGPPRIGTYPQDWEPLRSPADERADQYRDRRQRKEAERETNDMRAGHRVGHLVSRVWVRSHHFARS